jgi:hypothetical protein
MACGDSFGEGGGPRGCQAVVGSGHQENQKEPTNGPAELPTSILLLIVRGSARTIFSHTIRLLLVFVCISIIHWLRLSGIIMAAPAPSLPYHEPGIVTILIQSSFLLLLNLVNSVLDRLVYCGLLGQVLVGIAWGTPGAKWLSNEAEEVIVQLGYIGLILLVYEGNEASKPSKIYWLATV